ncbi:hypothetical protein ACMU_14800 [Actibacterium mucosum KCTC 23349]|uniref:Glycosyl transferase family 2 n=2 Tax=Actibacterium TaxID=1433986 RepID=A0A037ZHK5_9RHOB|nr:hypothetical protein ACMU_14800 [Actibacterium mucosum KCTC 23349]
MGATKIRLYLEGPDGPAFAEKLKDFAGCEPIIADNTHYATYLPNGLGAIFPQRQHTNATAAYREMDVDWILHIDADEFLQSTDLSDELDRLPADINSVRFVNGERYFVEGEEADTPLNGHCLAPLLADHPTSAPFRKEPYVSFTNNGFTAHDLGKSATRAGVPVEIQVHWPDPSPLIRSHISNESWLVHYDAITPTHWLSKLLRFHRANRRMYRNPRTGGQRYKQIQYFLARNWDLEEATRIFDALRRLTPDHAEQLRKLDLLRPIMHLRSSEGETPTAPFDAARFDAAVIRSIQNPPSGMLSGQGAVDAFAGLD